MSFLEVDFYAKKCRFHARDRFKLTEALNFATETKNGPTESRPAPEVRAGAVSVPRTCGSVPDFHALDQFSAGIGRRVLFL
ncbi:MAG: hypothetical protein J7619_00705 [Dyadobacter sp.]|uniref:hypothetical protein n=1 Tax=Dyadobacter sp. TaxID=1914288 RepID=UPI001B2D7325|nr:hypothetical protein [Dyadobacter sp.]MBO9611176.1 hypothetical protein [Dyadobacter sp.]